MPSHDHRRDRHEHGDHDARSGDADNAALAELLDLDAEVLRSYWTDVLTWVRRTATSTARILDLGAGTGTGTIALAQRFGGAEVIAVDSSEDMLDRVRSKALDLGLAPRISTVLADLDVTWPELEPVELTWASMSMHHFTHPDRVLSQVFATTRPGGLLAVAELAEPLRLLPDDVGSGRPGLEARCLRALAAEQAHALPELGSDWAPRLEAAGFTVLAERKFTTELDPPHEPPVARYAQLWLDRLRSGVEDRLADDDLAVLATLLDGIGPQSVRQREDLQVRSARIVTLGRRPRVPS